MPIAKASLCCLVRLLCATTFYRDSVARYVDGFGSPAHFAWLQLLMSHASSSHLCAMAKLMRQVTSEDLNNVVSFPTKQSCGACLLPGLRDVVIKPIRRDVPSNQYMRMIVSVHSPHLQRPVKAIVCAIVPSFLNSDSDSQESSTSYDEWDDMFTLQYVLYRRRPAFIPPKYPKVWKTWFFDDNVKNMIPVCF